MDLLKIKHCVKTYAITHKHGQNYFSHPPGIFFLEILSSSFLPPYLTEKQTVLIQALAICCEVEAVNYVETSAVKEDNSEALQLCALATMKQQINNNNFRRSPSIQVGPTGNTDLISKTP